tara:strand:+ start:2126 stop:2302 length:177 start_codon:yes stop_codon:yes gene_type:complete
VSKYKNPFEGPFKVVKDKKIKIVKRKSAYSSKPLPNDNLSQIFKDFIRIVKKRINDNI